jgi:4-amino-4-deoxy-L-arabinose transferase-like glycosyltransferase
LFDRDEPRFATSARIMAQTGDFIVPMFNGELRADKPPLVYWLMNIGYLLTGGWGELGARLPSAICGIGTLIVVYFMTGARFGRFTGFFAAMMLGSCGLFLFESRMATADGTMLFCISLCMACAWQAWDAHGGGGASQGARLPQADYLLDRSGGQSPLLLDHLPAPAASRMPLRLALLFWIALAAGTLTKGVPLLFVLVPMVVLSLATGRLPDELRQWRSHFHLTRGRVGAALVIALAVVGFLIGMSSASVFLDNRVLVAVVGALLIGMTLTPGLPAVMLRCFSGGNWSWWRQLRPLLGAPLLVILVAWWVIWAGMRTDWKLITEMVGSHFLIRVAGPLLKVLHIEITNAGGLGSNDPSAGPAKPPGTYLVLVWVTFWPWCILLVPAAYHTVRRLLAKGAIIIDPRPYQFIVAWIVPMWILLELARGKLLHYPLPLYVGLSILCADTLVQSWHRLTDVLAARWFAVMRWLTLLLWAGFGAAVLLGARQTLEWEWFWRCVPFAAALFAVGLCSAMTWGRQAWPYVVVLTWAGALLLLNTMILPELPLLQVSRLAGQKMAVLRKEDPSLHLAAQGYTEPTLVFYAGNNIRILASINELLATVPFAPHADPRTEHYVVAVDDQTIAALDKQGARYYTFMSRPRIVGLDLGSYKPVGVTLITNVEHGAASSTAPAATAESIESR